MIIFKHRSQGLSQIHMQTIILKLTRREKIAQSQQRLAACDIPRRPARPERQPTRLEQALVLCDELDAHFEKPVNRIRLLREDVCFRGFRMVKGGKKKA